MQPSAPMKQNQRVAIALFACLVAWLMWQSRLSWQHPILPPTEQPHQQTATPATSGENTAQNPNWNNWTHDPIAVFTGLLTLFNGLLFVSTIGLWLATRKSAGISERALTELERPFVFFRKIDTDLPNFYGLIFDPLRFTPEFFLSIVNYGRTPSNFDVGAIFYEVGRTIPDEFVAPEVITIASPHSELAEIIIGPDNEYRFPSQRIRHIFTQAHAKEIRDGTMFVYCHGFITYHGIFGNSHTTKFCRRYDAKRSEWLPDGGKERNNAN
jgi:hypothetical protein